MPHILRFRLFYNTSVVMSGGHVGAPSGGFNQPKAGGGFGGGGFGGAPARSSFSSHGSGMGSPSSGGAFKSALAGAAIGGLAGVAVGGLIAHATSPFSYGGHSYYWGPEYYKSSSGQFMCSMPLNDLIKNTPTVTTTAAPGANGTTVSDPNNVLQNLRFENGSKPHSIVWSCKTGTEVCCGTECCPNPQASSGSTGSSIAGIII
uniref:CX domain-containing protein n=1 Tax=Acrobeloides nanus TaxID=290746 RepID=A0A914E5L6_9BILA